MNTPTEEAPTYHSERVKPTRVTTPDWSRLTPFLGSVIIGIVIGMLALGLLSSSTLPGAVRFRQKLGINSILTSSGGTTVQQNVTVNETSAIINASQKATPAVVAITANQQVANFFGQISSQAIASGSGFIVSSDGLIMTNKHVVSEQGATYKVVLNDGRIFDGKVQAVDPFNDLAVVKIEATGLPTVQLGDSDALQVGQMVLAVGNALGQFQNSVTHGIISAKQRSIAPSSDNGTTEQLTDLLQTDAPINPGNSGGPLVNLDGQVVGITTAIASPTGGSIGIGFAIPANSVKPVIASVQKTGKIIRPYLGVRYIPVTPTLKQENNLSVDYGALVSRGRNSGEVAVIPGSPADKAGVQENDIILSVNGEKIDENHSLQGILQKYEVGQEVTLHLQRAGKEMDLKVTLGQQG